MDTYKKWARFLIVVLAMVALAACGGGSTSSGGDDDDDGDGGGNGGGGTGTTVTISGTLGAGTIANVSGTVSVKDATAAEGYAVVILNNESNKTYQATTGADGSFSAEVPSGSSYVVSLINDGSYIGPTVFSGSGSEVNMVITPSANEDLGSITVDESSGYAITSEAPDSVNSDVTAVASNGVPVGSGNDGKTVQGEITENRSDSDMDKDGIPNLFDADEDNDGIRNGVASTPSGAAVVSDYIESVFMSSNIWKEHGSSSTGSTQAEIAANEIAMWLNVVPKSGQEGMISSVTCTDVPTAIAEVAQVRWSDSIGDPLNYPDEWSLWKNSGYSLYKTTTLPQEKWIISLKPVGVMSVGDTFTIRVTYTDSTYEEFFVTMPYILIGWAKIETYDGTTLTDAVGKKTVGDQAAITDDTLTIVFSKPLDEDGNVLEGATYSVSCGESECSAGSCSVPSSMIDPSPTVTDNGDGTLTADIPTPDVGTTYYVTPAAEMGGQLNGEETWFIRE